jgi:hypothetical protein
MVTPDERMKILQMLQEGQITPESAADLLRAVDEAPVETGVSVSTGVPVPAGTQQPAKAAVPVEGVQAGGNKPRWLRVRVTDTDTGRPRVNVRLPMSLVSMGLKLGARYSPEIEGIDIESLLLAAQSAETGPFVDVYDEDDGEHVEVFLE